MIAATRHPSNVISGVLRVIVALVCTGVCVGGIAANGAVVMLAFTWQSNFMIAASFAWTAWALLKDRRTPPEWLAGSAVFYIAITGLVYNFVLNPGSFRVGNYVIAGLTGSDIAHVIIPTVAAAVWLIFEEHRRVPWRYIGLWLTYLVAYLVLIIGLISLLPGVKAPYPFLDVQVIGWAGVLGECFKLLIAFGSLAAIMVATDRWMPPRTKISEHDRFDEFNIRLVTAS